MSAAHLEEQISEYLEEEPWEEEMDLEDSECVASADSEYEIEPDLPAISIGDCILDVANEEWEHRFDIISANCDNKGRIRSYFLEGLLWEAHKWDRPSTKPSWCTAFAAYCYRTAHQRGNLDLPMEIHPRAIKNVETFRKVDRFLPALAVFTPNRRLQDKIERMPGPGSLIIWKGHVGLLRKIDEEGNLITIEGNTYILKDGKEKWGVHPRKYTPKTHPKRWDNLQGFGLIDG